MNNDLKFNNEDFTVETFTSGDDTIRYRTFRGIDYCSKPVDPIQKLNIFVPECYYNGESVNGYNLENAPIFMPNQVGGYMPGPAGEPGIDPRKNSPNSAFEALKHGCVVASAGVRGRSTGEVQNEFFEGSDAAGRDQTAGKLVGRAPAFIVDLKAAIRYLRHYKAEISGDTDKIITNGTSAGGALSALAGATGNSHEYQSYLDTIGAADERDDIFAASCYCPIHNLENADAAYEWMFGGEHEYHKINFIKTPDGIKKELVSGQLSPRQITVSNILKNEFPKYLNSLNLTDKDGKSLNLDGKGNGTFKDYIENLVIESAQKEIDCRNSERMTRLAINGSNVDKQSCLTIKDGHVTDIDWEGFIKAITRMKPTPAFDDLGLNSPECEEFGDESVYARHFTETAQRYSDVPAELADDSVIKLMNPTRYIDSETVAEHWRIRHGTHDRDTSLAVPAILALLLKKHGCDVDFFLPWGLPHSGDYDLENLFAWIDKIVKEAPAEV